jgi:hypothetical protein
MACIERSVRTGNFRFLVELKKALVDVKAAVAAQGCGEWDFACFRPRLYGGCVHFELGGCFRTREHRLFCACGNVRISLPSARLNVELF